MNYNLRAEQDVAPAPDDEDPAEIKVLELSRGPGQIRLYHPWAREQPPPAAVAVVVFGSGDGGWSYFERRCCVALAERGCVVVGVDFNLYAKTPFTPVQAAEDWSRWTQAGRMAAPQWSTLRSIWGGWSMGAEQAVAALGSGLVRSSARPTGFLLLAPGERGRYGLETSDQLGLLPTGEGTFALADFARSLGTSRVAQFHPELDLLDHTGWLEAVSVPHQLWTLGGAVHNFGGPSEEFYAQLSEALEWVLADASRPMVLDNTYERSSQIWWLLAGGTLVLLSLGWLGWRSQLWKKPSARPGLVAWVTAGVGLLNLMDAVIPRESRLIEEVETLLPLSVSAGSQWVQAVAGIALMWLARGLRRRKRVAWWAALLAFTLLPVVHLLQEFRWPYAALALGMAVWLAACRRHFVVESAGPSLRFGLKALPIAALLAYATAFAMLWHVREEIEPLREDAFYRSVTPHPRLESSTAAAQVAAELLFLQESDTAKPLTPRSQAVMRIIPLGGPVLALFALFLLLRPALPHRLPSATDRERVRALINRHGCDPLDEFALLPDKHYFFAADGASVVSYALWREYAVTLGDPIGSAASRARAMSDFNDHCRRLDWTPVFYEITAGARDAAMAMGLTAIKIAEDARLDLGAFKTEGRRFQRLRTALNHARKLGWRFQWYDPGERIDHGLEAQLRLVSDEWLGAKQGAEMSFDLGAFSPESLAQHGAGVLLNAEGRVEAFCTWLPFAQGSGRSLDLMRSRQVANAMDAAILLAMDHLRSQGIRAISLGNAPLANVDALVGNPLNRSERAVRYVYENFNKIYGYKSLFEFKDKFGPTWQPRYLAYQNPTQLAMIALALAAVHTPGGLRKYLHS